VFSKAKDNNGDAMFKWELDPAMADIHQIKRIELVDPRTLAKEEPVVVPVEQP